MSLKTCSGTGRYNGYGCGFERPIVAHGLCAECYSRTAKRKLAAFSTDRAQKFRQYMEDNRKSDSEGIKMCFFCGKPIIGMISHHHILGRIESKLTDREFIVDSHTECHVHIWHMQTIDVLMKYDWYEDCLIRLREKSEKAWRKEMYKRVKAGLMSEEEFSKL